MSSITLAIESVLPDHIDKNNFQGPDHDTVATANGYGRVIIPVERGVPVYLHMQSNTIRS